MDLIQLKMPPDEVRAIANAIELYIESGYQQKNTSELEDIMAYLRYRLALWSSKHPETPAA